VAKTDIVDLGPRRVQRGGHTLAERTWLDADGKATTEQGRGVVFLGPAGRTIPTEAARLAGLEKPKAEKSAPAAVSNPDTKIPGSAEEEVAKVTEKPKRKRTPANKARTSEGDK
jgi:hypothetical protein